LKIKKIILYFAGYNFWIFAFIFTSTYYPLLWALPISIKKKQHIAQDSNAFFFKLYINFLTWLKLIDIQIEGKEHLHQKEGCLFVANHPSMIDVLILLSKLPRVAVVIKAKVFSEKLQIGVKLAGYISNENPLELIEKCRELIENGEHVLIFPEGTRTMPGEKVKFARGAASLASLTSCKIIPIFISSEPRALYKGHSWKDLTEFPIRFKIILNCPIHRDQFSDFKRPTSALNQKLEELYHLI